MKRGYLASALSLLLAFALIFPFLCWGEGTGSANSFEIRGSSAPIFLNSKYGVREAARETKLLRDDPLQVVFLHGWLGNPSRLDALAHHLRGEVKSKALPVKKDFLLESYENTQGVDLWAKDIVRSIPSSWNRLVFVAFSMGGKAVLRALADDTIGRSLKERTELVITINTPYHKLSSAKYGIDIYPICKVVSWTAAVPKLFEGKSMAELYSGDMGDKGACRSLSYYSSAQDLDEVVSSGIPVIAFVSAMGAKSKACNFGLFDPYPNYADDGIVPLPAQSHPSVTKRINYGAYCHNDVTHKSAPTLARLIAEEIQSHLKVNTVS